MRVECDFLVIGTQRRLTHLQVQSPTAGIGICFECFFVKFDAKPRFDRCQLITLLPG